MSGSLGDLGNILRQAQVMQAEMAKAKEELAEIRVEGRAGGEAVRVTVSGDGIVQDLSISKEAQAEELSMLEDLVLAAMRDALTRANNLRDERLRKVTGGLDLPGMF